MCEMNGETAFNCGPAPRLPGKRRVGAGRRRAPTLGSRFQEVQGATPSESKGATCGSEIEAVGSSTSYCRKRSTARGGPTVSRVTRHHPGMRNRASIAL
ncbi:hypothetical protein MRX96_046086 [Rhipicephalus microplus]